MQLFTATLLLWRLSPPKILALWASAGTKAILAYLRSKASSPAAIT
jgi:hypothetical protein